MLTCFPLTAAFNDNIDIALRWADAGNSVFPCDPGLETKRAKRPLTERGFHDASNDHHKIREWWKR